MNEIEEAGRQERVSERVVKEALEALDWGVLRSHLNDMLLPDELTQICGHIRRCTDLIAKYPREAWEQRRAAFFSDLRSFVRTHTGAEGADQLEREMALISQIERGYRSIIAVLQMCPIDQRPAEVRASGCISRACHDYHDLIGRYDRLLGETKEISVISGIRLQDDHGNSFSVDTVLDGLSRSVATTLIMEAYKNKWFSGDTVALPDLPEVDDRVRFEAGATWVLALFWLHWNRLEKRYRFLGGELRVHPKERLPEDFPSSVNELLEYVPPEKGLSEREVYDYLANTRLQDRLIQTFMEMEVETGLSGQACGISDGAELPPKQFVSGQEAHAAVSLSEVLGYPIVHDYERPKGLRLIEWVRGYSVLKEIAESRTAHDDRPGDKYAVLLQESELTETLQRCGLSGGSAMRFVKNASLHRSCRDLFDCPLVRVGSSTYLLFAPAVINVNIAVAVLSNLSNRRAQLSRKGKAFEEFIRNFFRKHGMDVFSFKVRRGGKEYEYDAIVPWEGYLFVFECKNRSLSANDPAQAYYFDLEVAAQARQVRRLVDALAAHPDIIQSEIGAQYVGLQIVPCVLHSLPYSRLGDLGGVYFSDASSLTRFFGQRDVRIKVPHKIGEVTFLHRTTIKRLWKGEKPTAEEFLHQLKEPFQLGLSLKHLDITPFHFELSKSTVALTYELVRTEMTSRSVCEAVGVDADDVLQEIATVSDVASKARSELEQRDE